MYAAQEMFKTANKVTRPEKALILGFMAGSRGTVSRNMHTAYVDFQQLLYVSWEYAHMHAYMSH